MVEQSNAKKPFPQIENALAMYTKRIQSLSEVMEENGQRIFGHALTEPNEEARESTPVAVGEIQAVQQAGSILDDAIIELENKISNFMQKV